MTASPAPLVCAGRLVDDAGRCRRPDPAITRGLTTTNPKEQ